MPPKRIPATHPRDDDDSAQRGGVANIYRSMPAKFRRETLNYNRELHGFDLPARIIMVATSGGGKTNFLYNFIQKCCVGRGTFASITIVTADADEPLYNALQDALPSIVIKEGIQNVPHLDTYDISEQQNHLLVLDDLMLAKDQKRVVEMYIRGRKKNVCVVYIAQSYYTIPLDIRRQATHAVLLKLSGKKDLDSVLRNCGSINTTDQQLTNMYNFATETKLSPLVINLMDLGDTRYRRGFTDYLDPAQF